MAEVVVKSTKNFQQEITVGKHKFASDIAVESGGEDTAPGPHELLLGALGSCTAITMQMFAQKRNWEVKDIVVKLTEEKIEDPSAPGAKITKLTRKIEVGGNLTQEQLDGLKVAADKCQIHKLLLGPKEVITELKHRSGVKS